MIDQIKSFLEQDLDEMNKLLGQISGLGMDSEDYCVTQNSALTNAERIKIWWQIIRAEEGASLTDDEAIKAEIARIEKGPAFRSYLNKAAKGQRDYTDFERKVIARRGELYGMLQTPDMADEDRDDA